MTRGLLDFSGINDFAPAAPTADSALTIDQKQRDLAIRMLIAEANGEPEEGKTAVAHVMLNRLKSGRWGDDLTSVLTAPKQFEPWATRRNELMSYSPTDSKYQEAASIFDSVAKGEVPDPTKGALNFANVGTVQQRGNNAGMSWINKMLANGSAVKIGNHTFGTPGGQASGEDGPRVQLASDATSGPQERVQTAGGNSWPTRNTPGGPLSKSQGSSGMANGANPQGLLGMLGQQPPQDENTMGNIMQAIGLAMLSSQDRRQPVNGQVLGQVLQNQTAQADRRQDRRYGMAKDERDFNASQQYRQDSLGLQRQHFDVSRSDKETDNIRQQALADAQIKRDQFANDTPQRKVMRELYPGLETTDPKYMEKYKEQFGGGKISDEVNQRRVQALAMGMKEDNPAFQSYVLTGKMPREDAQPLSATDKKAIQEADEAVMIGQTAISSLGRAKELSKTAFEGPLAPERGKVAGWAGSERGQATTEMDNEVKANALASMKSIFGSNPTEGERAVLLEIQGSSSLPDTLRQKIYDKAIKLAETRLEFNKRRANELRGGEYYKKDDAKAKTGNDPARASQTGGGTTSAASKTVTLPNGVTIERMD